MVDFYKVIHKFSTGDMSLVLQNTLLKIYYRFFKKDRFTFNLLMGQHKYAEAIKIGKKIIGKGTNSSEMYRKIAFCSYYAHEKENAINNMQKSLELKIKKSINEIIDMSVKEINTNEKHIESIYTYLGGYSNYGFIEHRFLKSNDKEKIYLTKIIFNSKKKDREKYFYEEICKQFPQLTMVAPSLISASDFHDEGIMFLTISKIQGYKPINENANEILRINEMIESISLHEAKNIFKEIGSYKSKYESMMLHRKSVNSEIITDLYKLLKKKDNHIESDEFINRLKRVILGDKMYKKITPKYHYAFCHNDFHKNNILTDNHNNRCYVLDWNCYSYSLKGWDMAYYFGNFEFTFEEIKELYINRKYSSDRSVDEKVGILYYVFLQVYIWALRLRGDDWFSKRNEYFQPAIEYIELLAEQIRGNKNIN